MARVLTAQRICLRARQYGFAAIATLAISDLHLVSDCDKVEIEIRDFDQTVIGNPAHDLVRHGLSLSTAARGSDLPGVTTAQMLEEIIEGYANGLRHPREGQRKEAEQAAPIEKVLRKP